MATNLREGKLNSKWFGWFEFYGISTFVCYLIPNPFYTNNLFYFKQFSLALVHSLIVKNISISSYTIYSNSSNSANSVSISIDFVETQLNVKTVIYQTIQFSVSTVSMSKTVPFQPIQFSISIQFNCQRYFYFKLFSLVKQF